jgi:3'-phosphoadenosine 5'-phosphosulfate sulfotransferase
MNRITVTFYDEIIEKLELRTKGKGVKSISHCIRELVDLGFKVEEAAEKNSNKTNKVDEIIDSLSEVQKHLKNNLNWSLETRLLTRYMVENLPKNQKDDHLLILAQYKEKAISHVDKLLAETANKTEK